MHAWVKARVCGSTGTWSAEGGSLRLTDTLPSAVGAPTSFEIEGTDAEPTYERGRHQVTWTDVAAEGQAVTIGSRFQSLRPRGRK
jgi:hypothetical protein